MWLIDLITKILQLLFLLSIYFIKYVITANNILVKKTSKLCKKLKKKNQLDLLIINIQT